MKVNKLNEELYFGENENMNTEKEVGIDGAVNPIYRDALNTHKKIKDTLKKRFDDKEKEEKDFIKLNHKRETNKVKNSEFKKLKLSEALFEDYQDINQIKMVCKDWLEEELLNNIEDNLCNKFYSEDKDYDPDWCESDGSSKLSTAIDSKRDLYINSLVNVLFAEAGKNESMFENLEAENEDGWGDEVEDALYSFFESAEGLAYEIRNCVRGSYAVHGDTIDDLIGYLNSLSEELQGAIDQLSYDSETLQEKVQGEVNSGRYVAKGVDGNEPSFDNLTYAGRFVLSNAYEIRKDDKLSDEEKLDKINNLYIYDNETNKEITYADFPRFFDNKNHFINKYFKNESLKESAGDIYYKKTRDCLPDIITLELTQGETVYRENENGKLNPTYGPSLNIDIEDTGVSDDENGYYVIGWVDNEEKQKEMEAIADKYGKDYKSGIDDNVAGDKKFYTKIYVDEEEFDEPYFDPNVKVKGQEK